MNKQIEIKVYDHGEKLNKIFGLSENPILLCKRLRRIEKIGHKLSEDYCNGIKQDIDLELHKLYDKVIKLLGNTKIPINLNTDARGYFLKINNQYVKDNNLNIPIDWGGYGLIAPDLKEVN